VDFKDVLESASDAPASIAPAPAPAAPAANPFGGAPKPGPPAAGSIFGALPTAPGSLFGAPPAVGSSSLFPPAGSLFGASAPGGAFGGASTSAVDDDEDDEPPRPSSPSYQANESTEDDQEHVVMRVNKVKLHTKKDASEPNWADRGVNSFEFRREKVASGDGGSKRCRLLMRNQIGKAVLNAALYAKMSAQLTEKKMKDGSVVKNGVIVTLFNAEEDNSKVMVYLRFGKESDAKELHKLISENS
jgi:nuclear pore complex protein Nup50